MSRNKAMQILEVYDTAGVMTAKLHVEKKLWRWWNWTGGIPLALFAFYLFEIW